MRSICFPKNCIKNYKGKTLLDQLNISQKVSIKKSLSNELRDDAVVQLFKQMESQPILERLKKIG